MNFFHFSTFSNQDDTKIDEITLKNIKDYENASRKIQHTPIIDFCEEINFSSIFDDHKNYNDDLPFLEIRKVLILSYRLIWLGSNRTVTNKYFEVVINLSIVYICYSHVIEKSNGNQNIDLYILIFFCFEYFLRIINFGLFNEKTGILRNYLFTLELICIILGVITTFIIKYDRHLNLLIFRLFRVLKFLPLKNMVEIIEG